LGGLGDGDGQGNGEGQVVGVGDGLVVAEGKSKPSACFSFCPAKVSPNIKSPITIRILKPRIIISPLPITLNPLYGRLPESLGGSWLDPNDLGGPALKNDRAKGQKFIFF
jgi:hypothetical protein